MTNVVASAEEVPRTAPPRYSVYGGRLAGWGFVAVGLALLAIFIVGPFVMSIGLSFTNERLVARPVPTRFVGLDNYARLLSDEDFWNALWNTTRFALIVVPVQNALSLGLALLINSSLPGRNVFRTIYFLPVILSMTIISVIWGALYVYPQGALNGLVGWLSGGLVGPVNWLGDPSLAMAAIILCSIWASVGFQMVIFLAGLQNIPDELYEAARMDEASAWQQFWWITIPMLRPTQVFVLIATTIFAFKLFTQVELLTRGGPLGATDTLVRYIYTNGFSELRVGFASAATVAFLVIVLSIALVQRVVLSREEP